MNSNSPLTRRVFLARAGGLTLTLGAGGLARCLFAAPRNPYAAGVWLAGDHHIHTKYSPDGQYEIEKQVAKAARYGLHWCVITDHGALHHDKIALNQAYPDLVAARRKHPAMQVFQGLEWNIPDAEHGSVILPPTTREARLIADFEARYDPNNESLPNTPANTEADAVAAVKYLQSLTPKPLFIAHHPARRGVDSPHELRAWSDAGPDVTRGFEAAPGHQAAGLIGEPRGYYAGKPDPDSWPGYPEESYRTWGGYDWYVAKVGGLWDSLLGEGRAWYITANSDSHRHWTDLTAVDNSTYWDKGHTTEMKMRLDKRVNGDFYPGEYTKTWVFAPRRTHLAILDAMRAGCMFTTVGDLIDRLELSAHDKNRAVPMGGTLLLDRAGENVVVTIRLRQPERDNFSGARPRLHHLDLISGDILGPARDRDAMTNPTTRVVARLHPEQAVRSRVPGQGTYLTFRYQFQKVRRSFYVRVRGTNTAVEAPQIDSRTVNPWDDLWFYSNPIMVRVR